MSATETESVARTPVVDVSPSVLSSPRGLAALAGAVVVITLVQVIVNPISFLLGGYEAWPFTLPLPATVAFIVVACTFQAAALLIAVWSPPLATFAALSCYLGAVYVIGAPNWAAPMQLAVAVAVFVAAARRALQATALTLIATIGIQAGALAVWTAAFGQVAPALVPGFFVGATAGFAAPLLGGAALGVWWRVQSARVEQARATAEAERRENAARIAQAREAERAQVAQELHDVAGQHIMGLISLADAAAEVRDDRPEVAESLFEDLRREAQFAAASLYAALRELRSMPDSVVTATPDATNIDELVVYWRRRDVDVRLSSSGRLDDLPAVVSATLYRVAQESLTNAAKHAPGARVHVDVAANAHHASIQITNSAPHRPPSEQAQSAGLGWGIEGLRERIRLLDGDFEIGSRPDGGWRVLSRIPLTRGSGSAEYGVRAASR